MFSINLKNYENLRGKRKLLEITAVWVLLNITKTPRLTNIKSNILNFYCESDH